MLKFLVNVFRSGYLLNLYLDLVGTSPDFRYWSKILRCTIPMPPYPLIDVEVKVKDTEYFCLTKCLYHISKPSKRIHISNRVCFHSITTGPRVYAWGGAGGQSIEHPHNPMSLSSFFFFQMVFNFVGKARFRRDTLSCDSFYWASSCIVLLKTSR